LTSLIGPGRAHYDWKEDGGRKTEDGGRSIRSFRDIVAWQRAIDLAESFYSATKTWPADELFGLTAQIKRASDSVMANIAEGHGRSGPRAFLHHCSIADRSLSEVEAHLLFAHRVRFVDDDLLDQLARQIEETRRPLRGLIRQLR
jgi:four helix bundle protein